MNPIWILMLSIGIVGSNSLLLGPIARDIAAGFESTSATDILPASAAYGAATALSALLLAPQADVIGLRRSLILALTGLAAMLGLSMVAVSGAMLIVAQAGAGLAAGLALPATYGLATVIAPKGKESLTLGKVLTGWTLSLVVGVTLSAALSEILGWRMVYALLVVLSIGVLYALIRSETGQSTPRALNATTPITALRVPGVAPVLLSVVAYMVAFYGLYTYLGTHLTQKLGTSTMLAGLTALSYGVGFGIVAPLDRWIDKMGAKQLAPLVFALLAGIYVLFYIAAPWLGPILLVCFLWGALNHLGLNLLIGQLTASSPTQRGAILGLYSAVTYAAMSLGAAAYKPIFEAYGFAVIAVLSAICILPAFAQSELSRRAVKNIAHPHERPSP